ncbi:hypothetical protein Rleg10DRAFT_4150 [Rhizobium leguminosarum bv. trifolii WSM2012]|nr:hypothetical protein Rleg10DRAFT_4150 [Rhizobium leguminosarum bv. trifolii WSM2012]
MHRHRPWFSADDLKQVLALRQDIELPQYEGMGDPQLARKGAAVARNPEFGGDEEACLYGCQPDIALLRCSHQREKPIDLGQSFTHAAFRRRKDTMIDFEVGVSLSLPALPSGTSTFSSG